MPLFVTSTYLSLIQPPSCFSIYLPYSSYTFYWPHLCILYLYLSPLFILYLLLISPMHPVSLIISLINPEPTFVSLIMIIHFPSCIFIYPPYPLFYLNFSILCIQDPPWTCIWILNSDISRSWIATSFSLLLAGIHTIVSISLVEHHTSLVDRWQQLAANLLVFLSVNLVGLFIHNLTEEGQRRAFLDTRDCIAARLDMEDENEKLVSSPGGGGGFKRRLNVQ